VVALRRVPAWFALGVVDMHEIADSFALSSDRSCTLYQIRRDMIPDYYLLSFPRDAGEPSPLELSEMLVLGMSRAQSLARQRVGDPGAYSILYSGYSARREQGWHVHIVLLTGRWKKTWLYLVLAGKNALQAKGKCQGSVSALIDIFRHIFVS
jgi:hypothetical protein